MAMNFEELDQETRKYMLLRYESENRGGNPYRSAALSSLGLETFPDLMLRAIMDGTEVSLIADLQRPEFWNENESYERNGKIHQRKINPRQAAERLGLTEFNTWYVAGLAHRLVGEGETHCEVYRGQEPKWEHASCSSHEGQIYTLTDIINGHRIAYWPLPGKEALSIPVGPGCHHTIRRISRPASVADSGHDEQ